MKAADHLPICHSKCRRSGRPYGSSDRKASAPLPQRAFLRNSNFRWTESARKTWATSRAKISPNLDFVFTLADGTLGETCTIWPGQPICAHWGIEVPIASDHEDVERAFRHAFMRCNTGSDCFLHSRSTSSTK